jgi:peptidoglycan/LPS O-acetylase OafA/YrhL
VDPTLARRFQGARATCNYFANLNYSRPHLIQTAPFPCLNARKLPWTQSHPTFTIINICMKEDHEKMTVDQGVEMGLLGQPRPTPDNNGGGGGLLDGPINAVRSLTPKRVLQAVLYAITPEILQRSKNHSVRRNESTAYLDGLRGVAALIVCMHHVTIYSHHGLELCYGHQLFFNEYNNRAIVLPFIRNFFTGGHFSVMLFFIISGYVVPRRLITHLHSGRHAEFIDGINSAIFRRPGRLFFPCMFTTFAIAMSWHLLGVKYAFREAQANIFVELWVWFQDQMSFIYFFKSGFLFSGYNFTTWTIPVEMRGSMFMFVWLFAMHQCTTRIRILATAALIFYLEYLTEAGIYAAFFAGMFTAELDMLAEGDHQVSLPWDGFTRWWRSARRTRQVILHAMLIFGLFLGGQPSEDGHTIPQIMDKCWGWSHLQHLIPGVYRGEHVQWRWFWLFWGAWMTVIAIKEIAWARRIFETDACQCK